MTTNRKLTPQPRYRVSVMGTHVGLGAVGKNIWHHTERDARNEAKLRHCDAATYPVMHWLCDGSSCWEVSTIEYKIDSDSGPQYTVIDVTEYGIQPVPDGLLW
jgi:hypothetical protein